jgi:beta-glucosidase/6-phospho-beta-glucosidase/beta-galactosidase
VQSGPLFRSYFIGGFECSTHRTRRRRLDLIAATQHDTYVAADYALLKGQGIHAAREGVRWHLIERTPGHYDFSSALPMIRAAREIGTQIIWDLCHYGWPDGLDIFSSEFTRRFARLARAFTDLLVSEGEDVPYIAPVNEISFFSWAGGERGIFNPFARGRGDELKAQLVRTAIEGIEAIWSVNRRARILHIDPAINIISASTSSWARAEAERHRIAQYQAWDMLGGLMRPELGGHEKYLDVIGVNYYPTNQWVLRGPTVTRGDRRYKPFREILREIHERYGRPMFVAETGTEDEVRPGWLRYVGNEVRAALRAGVPVWGVCLYPILNHPGWVDDRHCHNGLWDYCEAAGQREIYAPLADELRRQQRLFGRLLARMQDVKRAVAPVESESDEEAA